MPCIIDRKITGTPIELENTISLLANDKFSAPHKVYLMGDSLTGSSSQYGMQLAVRLGSSWSLVWKGVPGASTTHMRNRFVTDVLTPGDAEYCIVWGGVNDISGQATPALTVENNLQAMYDMAHNAGLKVVAINIAPFNNGNAWLATAEARVVQNAVNAWIASSARNVDYKIDAYSLLLDPNNAYALLPAYDSGDHLHLSTAGFAAVADAVYDGVVWTPILGTSSSLTGSSTIDGPLTVSRGIVADGFQSDGPLSGSNLTLSGELTAGKTAITGTTVTDAPIYNENLLSADNWTSADWTGSFAAGWTHTSGNTTTLSNTLAAVANTRYLVEYTITGRTAGSVNISFGGFSTSTTNTNQYVTASGAFGPRASSTANLVVTPTSTFDGTIAVSVKEIKAINPALLSLKSSDAIVRSEVRVTPASQSTYYGYGSGQYGASAAINNAGFGYDAFNYLTTASYNTAVGTSALFTLTIGHRNCAVGFNSQFSNTSGYQNCSLGVSALTALTSGTDNCAFGDLAGAAITTGYRNVMMGSSSLGSVTTGYSNVGVGQLAACNLTTGYYNVALGFYAGKVIADGSTANQTSNTSVYVGSNVRAGANGAANEVVIGADAIGAGSNTVTLGNTSVTDTYLRGKLHLNALNTAPASASATGTLGEIRVTADALYVCIATDTWVKAALATWS
jgi:lysophospholipase L1-like esterase